VLLNFTNISLAGEFWSDEFNYLQINYVVNKTNSTQAYSFIDANSKIIMNYCFIDGVSAQLFLVSN